ncbi:membrane-associated zinc metalloprotease [Liquorilactobacillus sucicola DSM 21376 = JCM 15457]|uniref:Zinc metalloprotease n=1 Tax=Liquorilactobacillus sucicola DSM 21376 = JCM 15457 TaxID=1423806 RepID=A0A023CV68_9LACO|nr:RIP metalloprotease RseP [Liquorilactobacillus sucicola]KRN05373.1 M50 family membrane endopeptidase [Liquorilactobacillus sucicola DSM 21376 = JCM 15457]GAJ25445.1 membrane-associated zinc metalloprotease [Liquorilactobacillus sucicola DSM 21376 = JCM 15457]
MITTIITFIIIFGILVLVHEFGHFYFAKRANILVREFSIGMGPKIFSYHKNATTYTIRILPLGGYVRMAGLEDDDDSLKAGKIVTLILDSQGKVDKINTSQKKMLLNGIPLQVVKWDLEKELWIEGYENGDEDKYHRYTVAHDASVIEEDGTEVRIAPLDVQFQSAKLYQRMLTNFAGPLNNFILAIVAFTLVAVMQGGVLSSTNGIGKIVDGSAADRAGLKVNDKIVAVNNKKTATWEELVAQISKQGGKKTDLLIERDGKKHKVELTPKSRESNGQKIGQIGIESKMNKNSSPLAIITYGFTETWGMIVAIFSALVGMFTKGFSLNDLGGPVAMYSYTSQAAKYGVVNVIRLLAFLSVNLGVVNLLPIPALDGGKLLLNVVEGIRRKPISPEKEGIITLIGFGFLMLLMVLVTWNDIQRYFFN